MGPDQPKSVRLEFSNGYFVCIPQFNCLRLRDLTVWASLLQFNVIFRVNDLNSVGEYLDVIAGIISGKFKWQGVISPIIN